MSNGGTANPSGTQSESMWLKIAMGALGSFLVAATLKGWDNWATTNDVLTRLDERAKAREVWDAHQNQELQELQQGLRALSNSLETRGAVGREAILDLQRRLEAMEEERQRQRGQ